MKKTTILVVVTALTLTACSNDEVMEVAQTEAIGFSPFVNHSTRATDLDANTFKNFALWGAVYKLPGDQGQPGVAPAPVFINQQVAHDGSGWAYSPEQYWVIGSSYRFSGIAPYDVTSNGLTVEQPLEMLSEKPTGALKLTFNNETASAQKDLCYAFTVVEDAKADQGMVQLDFKHMLSRVKFRFVNAFPSENTYIKVSNIVIKDATTKAEIATVNLTADQNAKGMYDWTEIVEGGTFEIPFAISVPGGYGDSEGRFHGGSTDNTMETEHKYLIPLTVAKQYNISLVIDLYTKNTASEGNELVFVEKYTHENIALPNLKFDSNNSYTFITSIDASNVSPSGGLNPIEFTASVSDWETWDADNDSQGGADNEHNVAIPANSPIN